MNIYLFHRADGFYTVSCKSDAQAIREAKLNKGTIKVENPMTGKVVWMQQDGQ